MNFFSIYKILNTKYSSTRANPKRSFGFALVEVLVAVSIVSISIFAFSEVTTRSIEVNRESLRKTQSAFLLEEGVEAVKSIRDSQWSGVANPTVGADYYLSYSSGWTLSATPSTIDIFTRKVVFSSVSRDSNDDIVISGGTNDTQTRKATVTVSWAGKSGVTKSKSIDFYLMDMFSN